MQMLHYLGVSQFVEYAGEYLAGCSVKGLLLLTVSVLAAVNIAFRRVYYKLPPGPFYLPVLGNFSLFTNNRYFYKSLDGLRVKYGDLCYLRVGPYPLVLVSSHQMIRKIFVDFKDVFSDRANFTPIDKYIGMAKSNYHETKMYRKLAIKTLKLYGSGNSLFEDRIREEAAIIVDEIISYNGTSFEPHYITAKAVVNVIFMLVINKRIDYRDDEFCTLINKINVLADKIGIGYRSLSFLPISVINLLSNDLKNCLSAYDHIQSYIKKEIVIHEASYDENNIIDFIDIFIQADRENANRKHVENLHEVIFDLLLAGTETTNALLKFLFYYMCKYPKVQDKCRKEIIEVVGSENQPIMCDKSKLVYNDAMIHELMRLACIAPIAFPHVNNKAIVIDGYYHEKRTLFIPNLYSCHMNEETFPEPEEFKPERWIDPEGHLIKPPPDFMPFGLGPRSCVGDAIAKMEIFIFATTMIQRMVVSYEGEVPELDVHMGASRKISQNLKIIGLPVQ